ncbi:MAG: HAMP domain-containing sensor histidine kinase [Ilumatobacter sp.]|uniref:sensor histidine kinase n=1 Tax=Ilumatobacter sp. TaxID=1967498 RepID=UPI003C768D65
MTLRTRLLLGFTLIFVVAIAAGAFTVTAQRNQLYDQVDVRLMATPLPPELRASPASGREPPLDAPDRADAQQVDNDSISDLYVAVVTEDGVLRPRIEGQLLVDTPDVASLVDAPPSATTLDTTDGVDGASTFRVLFLPATDATLGAIVAVPVDDIHDAIRQLTITFAGAAALILLVLVLIASWVSRFGLRPISAMTDVAEAISSGERERRADIAGESTEAGRLGQAFNVMLDDRDRSDERLRQFVSNASHELRTPLTSIRGYLDLYAAGGFRKPGELDDAIRRMRAEAERMNLLVEDLLVLAKFDEEQSLDFSVVRVDEVAHDVAALALAAHPERRIIVQAGEPIEATADRLRLHQALAALVDNAIQHTPADSPIGIEVASSGDEVAVSVIDSGPGLTGDEAAAVFDRFSRGDRSRARRTGGSGLGLSIAQTIVRAHDGDISVAATPGDGATFVICIPSSHRLD